MNEEDEEDEAAQEVSARKEGNRARHGTKVREIKMAGKNEESPRGGGSGEGVKRVEDSEEEKETRSVLGVRWDLDARADATTSFVPDVFGTVSQIEKPRHGNEGVRGRSREIPPVFADARGTQRKRMRGR